MLKKIIAGVALAAGLATVSAAFILSHAQERGVENAKSIDPFDLMSQSRDLSDQTPATLI